MVSSKVESRGASASILSEVCGAAGPPVCAYAERLMMDGEISRIAPNPSQTVFKFDG